MCIWPYLWRQVCKALYSTVLHTYHTYIHGRIIQMYICMPRAEGTIPLGKAIFYHIEYLCSTVYIIHFFNAHPGLCSTILHYVEYRVLYIAMYTLLSIWYNVVLYEYLPTYCCSDIHKHKRSAWLYSQTI